MHSVPTIPNPVSHVDEVFADGTVYVRASAGPDQDSWASVPRDGAVAHAALRAPLNDPEHVLEQVAALTDMSKGGEEDLDGVKAVHYYGLLPYAALGSRPAPDVGITLDTLRTQLGGTVPVAAEVWVDGRGRVVRTRMTLSIGKTRLTGAAARQGLVRAAGHPVSARRPSAP
ncbi:hypothetical protein M8Z33_30130 [Streptomyces sp. ZAF1911]|uniref:hypothetical protein n=1 Tax=Streptomyces sp. ZAF1911 TaxID=2944129 RepID=UPI00237BF249|nr:hypothetical protein [Streptomyces sp. ZAF1911]MDD9380835.1 hypothetical protein [Streptomyces sp. ZAF1911]